MPTPRSEQHRARSPTIEVLAPTNASGIVLRHRTETPDERHATAAEALGQATGERHRDQHPEALRPDEQAGRDHALVAHLLVVERHEDHRPEQRRAEAEGRERGGREDAVGVQPDVEQRALDAQRVPAEGAASARGPRRSATTTAGAVRLACGAELAEAVDDRARRPSRAARGRARPGARPRRIRCAGASASRAMNATTPIGTLTRKIHDQCRFCRISPPTHRPEDRRRASRASRRCPSPGPSAWDRRPGP